MASLDGIKDLLATTASICQIAQLLSGVLVCKKFMKKGTSNDVSPLPFICGYTSCALWANYGNMIDDAAITMVNILGAMLMFGYVVAVYLFTSRRTAILKQMFVAMTFIVLVYLYERSIEDKQQAKLYLGYVCSGVTLLFFAAPLASLAHVVRTQSSEDLPFPIILMSMIVTALWMVYGYLLQDQFITYPNVLGFLLSCFQLSLFVIYPRR